MKKFLVIASFLTLGTILSVVVNSILRGVEKLSEPNYEEMYKDLKIQYDVLEVLYEDCIKN